MGKLNSIIKSKYKIGQNIVLKKCFFPSIFELSLVGNLYFKLFNNSKII